MRKLWNLIRNEWKKLFGKKTAAVMIILLLLATFAVTGLNRLLSALDVVFMSSYTLADECESQIEWAKEYQNEVDANGELTDYAQECRRLIAYYQYLLDIGADWDDWRYTGDAVNRMIDEQFYGEESEYLEWKDILDRNDVNAYFLKMEEISAASPDADYADIYAEAYRYCRENDVMPSYSDWRYDLMMRSASDKMTIRVCERQAADGYVYDTETLEQAKNDLAICTYRLENGLYETAEESGFWVCLSDTAASNTLIGLFMIILAGGIVAGEFSQGTIKFLLINPVKRWKILLSKYASVLLFGLFLSVLQLVSAFLFSLLFYGGHDLALPILSAKGGELIVSSPFAGILSDKLLALISPVVLSTLAFALSALTRSTAASIGISLFAFLSGSLVTTILLAFEQDWARYLLFANLDVASVIDGMTMFPHQSLFTAVLVLALHMIVFIWSAFDAFCKREV